MSREAVQARPHVWRAYALASAGGVLTFLGWAGFRLWPLEFVGLIPLWAALEAVADRSWRTTLLVGWTYGVVLFAGGYHFMWAFTRAFSGFGAVSSAAIFGAFSIYLGFQFALLGLLYRGIRRRGWSVAAAAVPTLPLTEWLYPMLFPVYLGNALIEVPILVQTVDLGGPLLASVTVATVNVALFECVRAARRTRSWPVGLIAGVLMYLAGTLIYGAYRVSWVEKRIADAPTISVGLVQANVSIEETQADPFERPRRYLAQTRALEEEVGPLDLIVWPEAAFYPWIARTFPAWVRAVRSGVRSSVLFGAMTYAPGTDYAQKYNSALLAHSGHLVGQAYDKNELVMFGEYLPFGDTLPSLYDLVPNSNPLVAGSEVVPLQFGQWRLFTPICYEDLLPILVRRAVRETNPHIFVNLTNDGWFGDSQGAWIHLRMAQLRAIEHRRYLLRAANTGVSAIVDPAGRVVGRTALEERDSLYSSVSLLTGQTPYARYGEWPGWVSLAATILVLTRQRKDS